MTSLFLRVFHAELRKCVDTRAARGVLLAVVLAASGALAINKVTEVDDFSVFLRGATLPLPALLPILAVLATTGDWTQRSAMTTFALVPQRGVVFAARLVAALTLVLIVTATISLIGFIVFTVVFPDRIDSVWTWDTVGSLASMTGLSVAAALTGTGAGFLLLNTPLAISVTILLPFVYDVAMSIAVPMVAPWVSILAFSAWLTQPEWAWTTSAGTGVGIGPALSSFGLFVLAPISAGLWRHLRREAA